MYYVRIYSLSSYACMPSVDDNNPLFQGTDKIVDTLSLSVYK